MSPEEAVGLVLCTLSVGIISPSGRGQESPGNRVSLLWLGASPVKSTRFGAGWLLDVIRIQDL